MASASTGTAGGTISYTVTLVNLGPSTAQNVTLTDVLSAGQALISASGNNGTTSIAEALHGHLADGLTLAQGIALAVAQALHGHQVDGLTLTQAHALTVAGAVHAHTVDGVVVSYSVTLAVAEALHAHTADAAYAGPLQLRQLITVSRQMAAIGIQAKAAIAEVGVGGRISIQ